MVLVPFPPSADDAPLVHAALDGTPASRWINAAHVTSMIPATKELAGHSVELSMSIKLQGLPEDRWHLGVYPNVGAANAAWLQFVSFLSKHS